MFHQISGYLISHSGWHIKVTMTEGSIYQENVTILNVYYLTTEVGVLSWCTKVSGSIPYKDQPMSAQMSRTTNWGPPTSLSQINK